MKALRDALKSADDGRHVAPSKLTFGLWAKEWLALKERTLKAKTHERYSDLMALHILPVLGARPLQSLTTRDIDRLYGGLTSAAGTQELIHFVLKSCVTTAVRKKLIPTNPVDDADKPKGSDQEAGTVLDEDQLRQLVKGFRGYTLYSLVATAAMTGARLGELLALRWVDIDFDAQTISITRSVEETTRYGRRITTPKTPGSVRRFKIDAGLVALLRSERDRLGGELVFPGAKGLRSGRTVGVMFRRFATKLGFPMRFHDLRGSHETALLDRGVPVHTVAERCGHDPAMLLKAYAKRTRKSDGSAAQVVGAMDLLGRNWVGKSEKPNLAGASA